MNEDLKKALESLIDETISEIEELKKSRFSAAEVKLHAGDSGVKDAPADGHLGKDDEDEDEDEDEMKHKKMDKEEEAKKEEDMDKEEAYKEEEAKKAEDEDEDEDEEEEKKPKSKSKMDKAEGKNREADPNGGHHQMDKGEGKNREADPDGGHHKMDGGAPMVKDEEAKKADMGYPKGAIKKAEEEMNTLMKSFFESRVAPLEAKLSSILDLVNKIADQPLPPKGVSARVVPLAKSADEKEPLNKAEMSSKLFDLKKSGTQVDSLDVTKVELGQDLQAIAKKYNLA